MPDERTPLLQDETSDNVPPIPDINPSEAEARQKYPSNKSLFALVIPMAVGIFLGAMDQTIVVSSYASIGSELKQLQNTSWIATSYLLTTTSIQPLYGKLSDIFGRKTCLLFAYTVFAVGCLLCGLSRNMTELIVSRALAGIGGGGMQTVVSIIMSDVVPLRSRGTWQGVLNIVYASGNSAGASLGGYFADTIGWRWAFLIQVPITVIAIISVVFSLHLPKRETGDFHAKLKRVDFGGAASLVFAVFFLLFALDRGGNISWSDQYTICSLVAFGVAFSIFAFVEMEWASEPFAPRRIIVNRSLIASYLFNFFSIAAAFSQLFHIPLYLQAVLQKSASEVGLWLIGAVVGGVTGSLTGGLIMQSTGKFYTLTVLSSFALFIGTIAVCLTTGLVVASTVGIVIGLVITSIGNGSGITTSLISLIANAGQEDQAIATAVSYLFRSLGSVVGLSVGSTIAQGTLRSALRRRLSGAGIDVDEVWHLRIPTRYFKLTMNVRESLKYIDKLDPVIRVEVRGSYEEAIRATLYFSVALAACGLLSSVFIKEKALSK
ncbi:hypothetical protein CVT25_013409 [Psilocybe cyanescens]|uniref:Major facilitator superfamily (MFS) profile domain-containing protein n=1 Tax=Psilocybe cyanescens TaxID=93625 RepID=A0A409WSW9_PSICY|nr:hypothetical protein CVT25_013409 [Psilocybe cyanescens]